ncbi:hypothetical protein [Haloechinothrix sp. LS1_15]|uniref:hypothetical protein n=1 Tax=Haloechinothrix sp. LS1_15 TaxID=2652248 RepID=UPI0029463EED|nr:hypothetical protein [Haloechinothrix sp. LS1_15]MDV6011084.1 glycosyltransferase [Haloechinothrix sp. LS1_15]
MTGTHVAYDILMVTDCRFPGGNTSSVVEEIHAQHRAGYRTGILHVPSPILGAARPFARKIRDVLDAGLAELVVGAEQVDTKLLLARHPSVFTELPEGLPVVRADEVLLAVNQVPTDERGVEPYYDVPHVQRQIERLVGTGATWAPIGPRTREALLEYQDSVPLLPWDWENVIDVAQWRIAREGFVADRPVLGRHSRGHWSKWPEDPADILAAYPDDPGYEVRILGGTDIPAERLGYLPANWVDYPFNSIPAREFLGSIDFFVYFHHTGLVEAFGRVVLEALAAGAVAIVPGYLEPLFGDACLYGTPRDVRGYVDRLYDDWDAFAARSAAGVELAERRFSYDTHVRRLAELIGPPAEHPTGAAAVGPQVPAAASQTSDRVLVADLRRETDHAVAPATLKAIQETGATCTVAVPAWHARYLPSGVAVETFPRVLDSLAEDERRRYLATRLGDMVATHGPAHVVVLDDGSAGAAAARLAAAERSRLDVLRVHRDPTAGTASGQLAEAIAASLPEGWGVAPVTATAPPRAASTKPSRLQRLIDRLPESWHLHTRARRKAWTLRREHLNREIDNAADIDAVVFEATDAEVSLPVPARVTHPMPQRLPVALVVVTGESLEPAATIRELLQRQQITSGFRLALLAPPRWEPEASAQRLAIETLVPESTWQSLHGHGWSGYLRRRVHEACLSFGPHTVVFADRPVGESGVLEVLEAARTRRRMETLYRRPR